MGVRDQHFVLQSVERCHHQRRVPNGVNTDVVAAAVRSATGKGKFEPHKPAMRRTDGQTRGLRHDRDVGPRAPREHRTCAQ